MSSATAYAAYRGQYARDAVSTASPEKLVTMLYDRLVLDLQRAELAQERGDREAANTQLNHAQEIVLALQDGLKPEAWSGGPALNSLYTFLHSELITANVKGDAQRTAACRELVEPLRDAWHEAARQTLASGELRQGA